MGRRLLSFGAFLLAATVVYWMSDAIGWIPSHAEEHWSTLLAKAALVCIAAGLVLRALSPARIKMAKGRCATCGRATPIGHMYCMDHLQESVNTWRDQTRAGMTGARRGRRP